MDSTQIGVYHQYDSHNTRGQGGHTFKQRDKVSFNSFLQSANSARLESQIRFEILSDFPNETLETKQGISMTYLGSYGSLRMSNSVDFW